MIDLSFYKDKNVFITGHTGFKGTWLSWILANAGAKITGYALPCINGSMFELSGIEKRIIHIAGDVRNLSRMKEVYAQTQPDIVFHLAAQPIVRESYHEPAYTYETNIMGTVNLMECVRNMAIKKTSIINVTTDKVYNNREWAWGYRETDSLDGYDPYSNSKSCSELVTHCYMRSFWQNSNITVSTMRAGNVIGGGDFAVDRIIPDCIRAAQKREEIVIRNPLSVRPYQYVLDPLFAYLLVAQKQYEDKVFSGKYNVGPNDTDYITTQKLVELFCENWKDVSYSICKNADGPHESKYLKLDCSLLKSTFGWNPRWNVDEAIKQVVEWTRVYLSGGNISEIMNRQISIFIDN